VPSTITIFNDEDEEITLPSKFELCPSCEGQGTNDAWEGGMTASEMDEQGPEFFDDYLGGMYDVPCRECQGKRVIEVVDEDRADPELFKLYIEQKEADAMYEAERQAEMRAGC
jgi:RecJ-like exonuclease